MAASIVGRAAGSNSNSAAWSLPISAPTPGNTLLIFACASGSSLSTAPTVTPTHGTDTVITDLGWSGQHSASPSTWITVFRIASIADTTASVTLPAITNAGGSTLFVYECSPGNLTLHGSPATHIETASSSLDFTITYGTTPTATANVEILLVGNGILNTAQADIWSVTASSPALTKDLLVSNVVGFDGDTFQVGNSTFGAAPTATVHRSASRAAVAALLVYETGAVANFKTLTAALSFTGSLARGTGHVLTSAALSVAGSIRRAAGSNQTASLAPSGSTNAGTTHGLAAALSTSGSAIKQTAHALTAAALSFVGSRGATTLGKPLAAAVSFAGTARRATAHGLAALLMPAGSVALSSAHTLTSAALSFAGNIQKQTGRPLSAGLTLAGTVQRQTAKGFAALLGLATPTAQVPVTLPLTFPTTLGTQTQTLPPRVDVGRSLAAMLSTAASQIRATARGFGANFAPSGTMRRQVAHAFSAAALSFAGAISRGRSFSQLLSAALTISGTLRTSPGKILADSLSLSATIGRAALHGFTATLQPACAKTVGITRTLAAAALSFAASQVRGRTMLLSAGMSFLATQARSPGKLLAAAATFAGNTRQATAHGFSAAASFVGSLPKQTQRGFSSSVSFAGSALKQTGHGFQATVSFLSNTSRSITHRFTAALQPSGTEQHGRLTLKTLTASLSFLGSYSRQAGKSLGATLAPAALMRRAIAHSLTATLQPAGTVSKGIRRTLAAVLSFIGQVTGLRGTAPDITLHVGPVSSGWTTHAPTSTWTHGEPHTSWTFGALTGAEQ